MEYFLSKYREYQAPNRKEFSKVRKGNDENSVSAPSKPVLLSELAQVKNVINLSISSMNIKDINGIIGYMFKLRVLNISHNQLESLDFLQSLKHLRILDARLNHIKTLPEGLPPSMTYLNLDFNTISGDFSHLDYSESLKIISLVKNTGLTGVPKTAALILDLQNSGIATFRQYQSLFKVNLSNCQIKSWPFFGETNFYPNLSELLLSGNAIESLTVTDAPCLRNLTVDCNYDLGVVDLLGAPFLEKLDVSFTNIKQLLNIPCALDIKAVDTQIERQTISPRCAWFYGRVDRLRSESERVIREIQEVLK